MLIDAHVHCFYPGYFPRRWFEAKAQQWAGRKWPPADPAVIVDKIEPGLVDADGSGLLSDLDEVGIDQAVCIGVDTGVAFGGPSPTDLWEHLARQAEILQRSSGRLCGFLGVDPRRRDPAAFVHHGVSELGFRGVKVYTPHGYLPADPMCDPIYEACVALGVPVMFHTGQAEYPLISHYCNPLHVQDVQTAYPELMIILGHAGFPFWWEEAALVADGHAGTFLEVSNWGRLLGTPRESRIDQALRHMKNTAGAHKILFGSDHFAGSRRRDRVTQLANWVAFMRGTDIFSEEERALVLGENAARLLNGTR